MEIAGNEAKWHGLIGGTLNLARTEHSCRIAIEQQAQQHFGGVGFPTARPIAGIQSREVKQGHTVHHETGQMVRWQTVTQAYCQIQRLVIVHGFECSFHAPSLPLLTSWRLLLSDKLLGTVVHGLGPVGFGAPVQSAFSLGRLPRLVSRIPRLYIASALLASAARRTQRSASMA